MAKQKSCHKLIYKLPSNRLKTAKWNLTLPLQTAMQNKNDVVAISDSQVLRWIYELNGVRNIDETILKLQIKIKQIKKSPKSKENKNKIKELYEKLYSLQYQKDYLTIIMNTNKDYDRANKGFKMNGYTYRRLLGTNGGIKKSTITYIQEAVYEEIIKRMDNGRDKNKPIVPAKLEAYQALICSSSTPVTTPRILIVEDCNVIFKEDVLKISDDNEGEPQITLSKDCEIEYCDSDGYGLMSPEYSRIVNADLHGEEFLTQTITGINVRYAWTKGMLFTFDFVMFGRQMNDNFYLVLDAWGALRDIREYDVILTTSMVKLWDSYNSLEHYIQCCNDNKYQFCVVKATPHKLENVRNLNYQFLQTYQFTDEELYKLCKPTIDEITDVLGGDYRKSIVFLKGMFLENTDIGHMDNDFIKGLMIDKRMIEDDFVIKKIHFMIRKRIEMAAKGSIKISGNFATISGDLYSLAQSIYGLPVTGLLKAGEVYQKYWLEKQVERIALFRAPMTCHNNIRVRQVVSNEEMDFWYQYNTTGMILNSWDTTCDALNGADKDSDTFFSTDNDIIIKNTKNSTTIKCMQRNAAKILPTEADLIQANKLAFGDEIGTTTNRITGMIERQSAFCEGSKEYKILDYRIKCGQHYQQNAIDKAKGIIAKPMPKYWYDKSACNKLPENTEEEKQFKELCLRIVAQKKPHFMKYIYPDVMAEYKRYLSGTNSKCIREFKTSISDLIHRTNKTASEEDFINYYKELTPVGTNPCTVNRISWLFEETFGNFLSNSIKTKSFDSSILKSGIPYNKKDYKQIEKLKTEYHESVKYYKQLANKQRLDKEDVLINRNILLLNFKSRCEEICPNEKELCDIIIDLCYSSAKSKQFAWDICGDRIIQNLLEQNQNLLHYPALVKEEGEFEFAGEQFIMCKKEIREDEDLLLF